MSTINEPVSFYKDRLKNEHSERVARYFEDLVTASGVDAAANRATVSEISKLEAEKSSNKGKRNWWIALRVALWSAAVVCGFASFSAGGINFLLILLTAALIIIDLSQIGPRVKALNSQNAELDQKIETLTSEAWDQMEPLNQLFRWNMSKELAAETFPDLVLDEYFSETALYDLVATYGLDGSFNQGRSILRTQSGNLNQNPLVFYRYLQHWIGTRVYSGSLVIHWTETIRNAQGQMQTVQRSQTLHATVAKAFPEFAEGAALIFGHEAAPNLSFSRSPSNLSGAEDTRFNAWRKSSVLKGIEKQAKKQLKSGLGQLTTMSNREFETLFKAVDRDHEIEFRLLFTPLAQQEMVKVLNDKSEGHGDDFVFVKRGKVNYIEAENMVHIDLDPSPTIFCTNDLEESRRFFNTFNVEFFRSLFFGIAPLLTVPLYTESRRLPIAPRLEDGHLPNAWEVEVMANELGEENLRHPNSVTRNLLTAEVKRTASGGVIAEVDALGYQGFDRVDFVPVLGGDGNWHQVPVPWVEYISVQRQSQVFVGRVGEHMDPGHTQGIEFENWPRALDGLGAKPESSVFRAHLGAAIIR